jgi:aldehyde dehydrogenase (NAD+)
MVSRQQLDERRRGAPALRRQRQSGNGSRQSGIWVLDQFTRWQSLNWDYAGRLQKAQMDTAELAGDPGFTL